MSPQTDCVVSVFSATFLADPCLLLYCYASFFLFLHSFAFYLAATIFAGVLAFTNLGEMLEQYLKQLNQRKSK